MGATKDMECHLVEMDGPKQAASSVRVLYTWISCMTVIVVALVTLMTLIAFQNRELSNRVYILETKIVRMNLQLADVMNSQDEELVQDVVMSRRKRELPTEAQVVEGSYNPTQSSPSEGLRLYERWQVNGDQKDPLSQEITVEQSLPPVPYNYTRTQPRRRPKRPKKFFNSAASVPVMQRRSRVKQTGTTAAPSSAAPPRWELITDYDGITLAPEITHLANNGTRRRRRRKHRRPHKKQLRSREEDNFIEDSLTGFRGSLDLSAFRPHGFSKSAADTLALPFSRPMTAAMYYADGDMAKGGSHHFGNYRVRNGDRKFIHLRRKEWMEKLNLQHGYKLRRGDIVISQPGLYYVFAQVQYSDMRDLNGFQIDVNEQPVTNCIAMTTTSPGNMIKSNTCFTGTLVYLNPQDRVGLRDMEHHRISLQKDGHTYIGLFWLSDGTH